MKHRVYEWCSNKWIAVTPYLTEQEAYNVFYKLDYAAIKYRTGKTYCVMNAEEEKNFDF